MPSRHSSLQTGTATTTAQSSTASTASTIRKLLKEPRGTTTRGGVGGGSGGDGEEREDASRLDELRRIFATLAADGDLVLHGYGGGDNGGEVASASATADARLKWEEWLRGRHAAFLDQLCDRVRLGRRYALRTLCGVVASTPRRDSRVPVGKISGGGSISRTGRGGSAGGGGAAESFSEDRQPPRIDEDLVCRMLDALCVRTRAQRKDASWRRGGSPPSSAPAMDGPMLNLLAAEFVRPHRDAQYFTLLAVRRLAEEYLTDDMSSKSPSTGQQSPAGESKSRNKGRDDEGDAAATVADNLLRILEVVPIANDGSELLREGTTFLFQPPTDSSSGSAYRATQISDGDDDDSDADDSSSEEDDSDEDEGRSNDTATSGKRSRSNDVSNERKGSNKRARTRTRKGDVSPLLHLSRYRRAFEGAWLALIRLPSLPPRSHRRILRRLPECVLPHLHHKLRLADYLTNSYDRRGDDVASLLALDGLFVLMTRHGLEHPQFYASLYARVNCRAFHARYRARFFRLLTTCLSSSQMLPAYVVAAFCKRLCRCALSAPPSGALFVLALVSNLLRRHEACGCLVHRGGGEPIEDVYDADVDDPYRSRALESSLWELSALERHYHPAVATLAKACGREGDKDPLHDMDEFLLHTYRSLFEQEANRRIGGGGRRKKKRGGESSSSSTSTNTTPLAFREPKSLFVAATEEAGGGGGDVFGGFLAWPTRGGAGNEDEHLSGE